MGYALKVLMTGWVSRCRCSCRDKSGHVMKRIAGKVFSYDRRLVSEDFENFCLSGKLKGSFRTPSLREGPNYPKEYDFL